MIYPGTSPMVGSNDPNSLEQRKQQLMKQLTGGQGIANNLSFGGSAGDAPARGPSLSFNPFMSAIQHILGNTNAGQANNIAVSGHPFFGGAQNIPGNATQSAAVTTGVAAGSAGIGGVAGSPAAAPSNAPANAPISAPTPFAATPAPFASPASSGGVTGIPNFQIPSGHMSQLFSLPPGGFTPPPPKPILNLAGGLRVFGPLNAS